MAVSRGTVIVTTHEFVAVNECAAPSETMVEGEIEQPESKKTPFGPFSVVIAMETFTEAPKAGAGREVSKADASRRRSKPKGVSLASLRFLKCTNSLESIPGARHSDGSLSIERVGGKTEVIHCERPI